MTPVGEPPAYPAACEDVPAKTIFRRRFERACGRQKPKPAPVNRATAARGQLRPLTSAALPMLAALAQTKPFQDATLKAARKSLAALLLFVSLATAALPGC